MNFNDHSVISKKTKEKSKNLLHNFKFMRNYFLRGFKKIVYYIGLVCFVILMGRSIFLYALFTEGMHLQDDMHQEYLNAGIIRNSILEYKRIPLWTPHVGGGYPLYAYPRDGSLLIPFVISPLVFGEVQGTKLNVAIIYLIGVMGMFLYARYTYKREYFSIALLTILYAASPFYISNLVGGNYTYLLTFMFPLIAFFYKKGRKKPVYLFIAALCSTVIAIFSKFCIIYVMVILLFFSICDFVAIRRSRRNRGNKKVIYTPFFSFAVFVIMTSLFSLFKLIPAYYLVERSEYFDISVKHFFWFKFRYFQHVLYFLGCISVKHIYDYFVRIIAKGGSVVRPGVLLIVQIMLIAVPYVISKPHVPCEFMSVEEQEKKENFYQIRGRILSPTDQDMRWNTLRTTNSLAYFNFLRNIGTIDWDASRAILPTAVQPRYFVYYKDNESLSYYSIAQDDVLRENPLYKGEAYFVEGEGKVEKTVMEPNRCKVFVSGSGPCIIAVNQNYDPNWMSSRGKVKRISSLLGVEVRLDGREEIVFSYHPKLFYYLLVISILSIIYWGYLLNYHRKFIAFITY